MNRKLNWVPIYKYILGAIYNVIESRCLRGEVPCDENKCISLDKWCDNVEDCGDKIDEKYCETIKILSYSYFFGGNPNSCGDQFHICGNGICFPTSIRCDEYNHCEDASDEKDCSFVSETADPISTENTPESSSATRMEFDAKTESTNLIQRNQTGIKVMENTTTFTTRDNNDINESTKPSVTSASSSLDYYGRRMQAESKETTKHQFRVTEPTTHLSRHQYRIRNASAPISLPRTAMFINALLATCGDPRDFNGINIVEDLKIRAGLKNDQQFVNPLVYISLCLSDVAPQDKELLRLQRMMNPAFPNEEISKDIQVLAFSALACFQHLTALNSSFDNRLMESTVQTILSRRLADGSYGNIYNTALILQAMFAINSTTDWQPERSLQYLAENQLADGSFGDFFATYLAITALSGRSLVHLRNTKCNSLSEKKEISPRNSLGQFQGKKDIQFSVYFGYPTASAITLARSVPSEFSVFDIMRFVENGDGRFRFKYENENGSIYVTSIHGIPNDSERGRYWHLYIKKPSLEKDYALKHEEMVAGGIGTYYPKESEHVVFWYH
ncbi:uncharacterized protein LOC129216437 [Uloborus diversus]|uniref:uncharacterized protein LOC129216437 n=1 Tax=Uloborus diversus TaxID=327109 RepID=UPI00240A1C65|nr:uncharacterized protein LOC129216437 [Uloborus diversus]